MLMTTPQVVSVDTVVNHRTYEGLKMNGGLVYLRTTTLDWPDIVCAVAVFQPDCFKKRQNPLFAASYSRTTPTRQASSELPLAFPVSYEALYFKGWPVSAL
jgi:hypothetical protein